MKRLFALFISTIIFKSAAASSFTINAEYSTDLGLPIADLVESAVTSFSALDLNSREQCLTSLGSDLVRNLATGYALSYGASSVVLKCTEYWENENCDTFYPGCISSSDFGNPIHIYVYHDNAMIPSYLRLRKNKYQVVQTIAYRSDQDDDGYLDIGFVVQHKFDEQNVPGPKAYKSCKNFIESSIFTQAVREEYFSDERTKAYKVNCFSVSNSGKASGTGSVIVRPQ